MDFLRQGGRSNRSTDERAVDRRDMVRRQTLERSLSSLGRQGLALRRRPRARASRSEERDFEFGRRLALRSAGCVGAAQSRDVAGANFREMLLEIYADHARTHGYEFVGAFW